MLTRHHLRLLASVLLLPSLFLTGQVTGSELPHATPLEVGLSAESLAKIQPTMQAFVDRDQIAGAITVVTRHGKIAHTSMVGARDRERGLPMTEDAIFRIYSMSKPITGVALMTLFDEGKFQLEDPVCRYLPEFKNQRVHTPAGEMPVEHDMTIRELMSHSGGLTYGVFGNSPVDQQYRAAKILDRDLPLVEMVRRLGPIPLEFQPGTRWLYSVSVDVQGRLIEVLSGMPFDRFLRERLFTPLEMRDTGFFVPTNQVDRFTACYQASANGGLTLQDDPTNSAFLREPVFKSGGGGLVSTSRDYLRFAQMLLNGGELDGHRILERSTVELMRRNHLPEGVWVQWGPLVARGTGFGLDVAVRTETEPAARRNAFWWTGMATTRFCVWPEADLVVLSMTQRIMDSGILTDPLTDILVEAIETPADPADYLSGVCAELTRCWPTNRTINLVCHGHSVPAGYFKTPRVDTFNAYPYLLHRGLKERFPHAVINVIVTAIGGENSESGAQRFERDVLALRPDVVLIDYSLNDRGLGLERTEAAWRSMITQAAGHGIKVILLTPTPDQRADLEDPDDPLVQHADQVRTLAGEFHVGLVDSLAAFKRAMQGGRPLTDLMSQVNHPNRAGHELVTEELLRWFPPPAAGSQ
ncbi:MAG: serine hydrolase [Verrucomicrobiales bacterium]|nr:serine hydrolase [Verrucomicrobiales bacterium]